MFKLFNMFQDTLEAYSIQNLYIVKHFGSKKLMLEVKTTFAFFLFSKCHKLQLDLYLKEYMGCVYSLGPCLGI